MVHLVLLGGVVAMGDQAALRGSVPEAAPRAEPDGAPRLMVLDIMRGIAILGILFMNVNDMGQSITASWADIRHLGWGAADQIVWWIREVFANGTARCLLEILFGAGMVILTERIAAGAPARWAVIKRYYWRNFVLWAFGMIHMFILLWPGDILHTYGVAAMVAFLFRRLRPRWLITLGLSLAVMQFGLAGYFGVYQAFQRPVVAAALQARRDAGQTLSAQERITLATWRIGVHKRAKAIAEGHAGIIKEDRERTGTTVQWVRAQWAMNIERLWPMELFAIWEAAGTMLIGAALFKLGILQGDRPRRFYARLTVTGYAIGVPLRTLGAWEQTRFDDLPQYSWATSEVARLAMTLGHVGAITLLVASVGGLRLLRPFAAAGRTALTLYVLQTLVMLWVLFPPFALGLYGRLSWAPLMAISLLLDALLLWAAVIYLRHYRIAPVEWAWRSVVERRRLPFRRGAAAPPPGVIVAAEVEGV